MTSEFPKIVVKSLYVFCCYIIFLNEWQPLTTLYERSSSKPLNSAAFQYATKFLSSPSEKTVYKHRNQRANTTKILCAIKWKWHTEQLRLEGVLVSSFSPTPCSKQGQQHVDYGHVQLGFKCLQKQRCHKVFDHFHSGKNLCLNWISCVWICALCLLSCLWTPLRRALVFFIPTPTDMWD